MSELRLLIIATLIMILIGGVVPQMVSSFVNTDDVSLTGTRLSVYNILSSGVDLTGSYDIPENDNFYDYLIGIELITNYFSFFTILIFIYLFILLYTIVKALPFT